ncbi:hypothetical protein BDV59DRAFT_138494 [Aspergillus ambiguus]|uniref:uncharacterized protein n=1 Tax=Aspergillus ambiguus TaxID=176160 RepID=UPI003CCD6B43
MSTDGILRRRFIVDHCPTHGPATMSGTNSAVIKGITVQERPGYEGGRRVTACGTFEASGLLSSQVYCLLVWRPRRMQEPKESYSSQTPTGFPAETHPSYLRAWLACVMGIPTVESTSTSYPPSDLIHRCEKLEGAAICLGIYAKPQDGLKLLVANHHPQESTYWIVVDSPGIAFPAPLLGWQWGRG